MKEMKRRTGRVDYNEKKVVGEVERARRKWEI